MADVTQENLSLADSWWSSPMGIILIILLVVVGFFILYVLIKKLKRHYDLKKERKSLKDDLMVWSKLSKMVSGGDAADKGKQDLSASYELIKSIFDTASSEIKKKCNDHNRTPWYVVLGEPLSGKTSLFKGGKLHTDQVRQDKDLADEDPIHFHLHRDRVFLDIKGKVFFDHWLGGSSAEWYSICELIEKYHYVKPISAILLTIPADALIADDETLTEKKASLIFSEISHLLNTVRMRIPVRVVITKADCIVGFREFFASVESEQRAHMMGVAVADIKEPYREDHFLCEWNSFIAKLQKEVLDLLFSKEVVGNGLSKDHSRIDYSSYIFSFPRHVEALKISLLRYLRIIFDHSANQSYAFIEGVYFCSSEDLGTCFDADFASLKQLEIDEVPLSVGHTGSSEPLFLSTLMGSSLDALEQLANFTKRERMHRNIPALCVGVLLGIFSAYYLIGALLSGRLISDDLTDDVYYYHLVSDMFKKHAMLESPLLDVDKNSLRGIDRFDYPMAGMPDVTRVNYFVNTRYKLLAQRPLPWLYFPSNFLFYDMNNIYHEQRQTIYNQIASDMIFFPAAQSFSYNLLHDESAFTQSKADALLSFIQLALVEEQKHPSALVSTTLRSIVDYMYPSISRKLDSELSNISNGDDNYAKGVIRRITLHRDFVPSINNGIKNFVLQTRASANYPESDYQQFKQVIKISTEMINTSADISNFLDENLVKTQVDSWNKYQTIQHYIENFLKCSHLLDENYKDFLYNFSQTIAGTKEKSDADKNESLDLQRMAKYEKSYIDYKDVIVDDFDKFVSYSKYQSSLSRNFDYADLSASNILNFKKESLDALEQEYMDLKHDLQNVINSKLLNRNSKAKSNSIVYDYNIAQELYTTIYVPMKDLPLSLESPEMYLDQFKKIEQLFHRRIDMLNAFLETNKDFVEKRKLIKSSQTFLEYSEFVAKVKLTENLLDFYPDDNSLMRTIAKLAQSSSMKDVVGINELLSVDDLNRVLGSFGVNEEYSPAIAAVFLEPMSHLLSFSSKKAAGDKKNGEKENKSKNTLFSNYVDNNPRIKHISKFVNSYADSYVNYWASIGDTVRPAFYDYGSFHKFALASRSYEINAQLQNLYNISYDILSEVNTNVMTSKTKSSRDHALTEIDVRRKLLDLNFNQACTNVLSAWSLLPEDPVVANRYLSFLDKKTIRNDYTLVSGDTKSANTIPWWDSFVRLGTTLLKSEANHSVVSSLVEFQNKLYYFPILRNADPLGQTIPQEDMYKLRQGLLSFGIQTKSQNTSENTGDEKKSNDEMDTVAATMAHDEGVDLIQAPLLSGVKAGRDDVGQWASNVDFLLKTLGDQKKPLKAKIAIPNLKLQNHLIKKFYGDDFANATLRFRYLEITAGTDKTKQRYSTVVDSDGADKIIYDDSVSSSDLELNFFRYSDDKKPEAKVSIGGAYAPLRLYLDENLIQVNSDDDKTKASYVPLVVQSADGDDSVLFLKIYFDKPLLAPEDWPSTENWPLLSSY